MKYQKGDKVVWCPPHRTNMRGVVGTISDTDDVRLFGVYVQMELSDGVTVTEFEEYLRHLKECDRCKYRLRRLTGRCPDVYK